MVLLAEIAIATLGFNRWIRGFLGDVLVVPLLYLCFRMLLPLSVKRVVLLVWSAALLIEVLQALKIPEILFPESSLLLLIFGNTFDWLDVLAYTIGAALIIVLETIFKRHQ